MKQLVLNFQVNKGHARLFIALGLVDLAVTILALNLGSSELNPVMRLGSLPILKVSLTLIVLLLLLRFSKGHLLKLLNIGLGVVVVYNIVALASWL